MECNNQRERVRRNHLFIHNMAPQRLGMTFYFTPAKIIYMRHTSTSEHAFHLCLPTLPAPLYITQNTPNRPKIISATPQPAGNDIYEILPKARRDLDVKGKNKEEKR